MVEHALPYFYTKLYEQILDIETDIDDIETSIDDLEANIDQLMIDLAPVTSFLCSAAFVENTETELYDFDGTGDLYIDGITGYILADDVAAMQAYISFTYDAGGQRKIWDFGVRSGVDVSINLWFPRPLKFSDAGDLDHFGLNIGVSGCTVWGRVVV